MRPGTPPKNTPETTTLVSSTTLIARAVSLAADCIGDGSVKEPAIPLHMPSISGIPGPYRFLFYSFDCNEPLHDHVRRDRAMCKFWLDPTELSGNWGFSARGLTRIRHIIFQERHRILEAWREHCGETR